MNVQYQICKMCLLRRTQRCLKNSGLEKIFQLETNCVSRWLSGENRFRIWQNECQLFSLVYLIYLLKRAISKACCKYSSVIFVFKFNIYLLKRSQEGSGENFPAGRRKNFRRQFMQQIVGCVCLPYEDIVRIIHEDKSITLK